MKTGLIFFDKTQVATPSIFPNSVVWDFSLFPKLKKKFTSTFEDSGHEKKYKDRASHHIKQ